MSHINVPISKKRYSTSTTNQANSNDATFGLPHDARRNYNVNTTDNEAFFSLI
ncbi:MAG TPA: hypothetical protein ACQGQI_01565 [Xylella sp.]